MIEPATGMVFSVCYPFVRDTFSQFDGEDYVDAPTWKPGIRYEAIGPEDSGAVADAEGWMKLTVEAVFKPGRFPTRVFYTRAFINPDGKPFGKGGLKICTLEKFRRIALRYQHRYGIGEPLAEPSDFRVADSRKWFEEVLAHAAGASVA